MTNETDSSASQKITTWRRKRGQLKRKITDFNTYLKDLKEKECLALPDVKQVDERIGRATTVLEQVEEINSQLCEVVSNCDDDDTYMSEFENLYFTVIAEAKAIVEGFSMVNARGLPVASEAGSVHESNSHVNSSGNNMLNTVKLPTIALPKFNGLYIRWLEFRDTFSSLIHDNESLNDVQKFHYLKASLEGEATDIIKSMSLSASNYNIAWNLLCSRFENKKLLIQNHLNDIFKLKSVNRESANNLREMSDTITKNLRALDALGQPTEHWDAIIVFVITSKFDKQTARDFETFKIKGELPTIAELKQFLNSKADLLDNLSLCHRNEGETKQDKGFKSNKVNKTFVSSNVTCYQCKASHAIYHCDQFLQLPVQERIMKVKALRLCNKCLRQHGNKHCFYRGNGCKICRADHNTLLHVSTPEQKDSHDNESKDNATKRENTHSNESKDYTPTTLTTYVTTNANQVLLATAEVKLQDKDGRWQVCRALLDSASQSNFITVHLLKRLGIETSKVNIAIQGINQIVSPINLQCDVSISSRIKAFISKLRCLVIDKISEDLPSFRIKTEQLQLPDNLQLADSNYDVPGNIDLLIGAQLFWSLLIPGRVKLGKNLPVLQNTHFGWILSGPMQVTSNSQSSQCFFTSTCDIQQQLQLFWQLEECQSSKPLSLMEKQCETQFINTVSKDETGRFIVTIPFKASPQELGNSKVTALKRFHSLEKRLNSNSSLKELYSAFINEYISLGHMSYVEHPNDSISHYYIPHHAVINEASRTTKLRVVFDGSCSTSSGKSFNDIQMVGPTLQSNLLTILIRFRQNAIAFSVDIQKMYRQVLVSPNQRCFQRIFWRDNSSCPLSIYELNTVTYGTASAPYLATRCLLKIAEENADIYPEASEIIKSDSYVDDILSGANTAEKAAQLCDEISVILLQAHFTLHKWVSNDRHICRRFTADDSGSSAVQLGSECMTKTLGLYWSPSDDTLNYKTTFHRPVTPITKRKILSSISQVFDPLGLVSACTITGKVILQLLWQEHLNWDDQVPIAVENKWTRFTKELPILSEIKIARHILCPNPIHVELHGFSDASETAYCACVYARSVSANDVPYVSLVCAKTKVAPLKKLTIPRLELCAAQLLAKLITKVKESLRVFINSVCLWTDSTIVLGWIKTPPNVLKVFVSHRVADIQSLCQNHTWSHVSSAQNPADLGSRGVFPSQLKASSLWWHGPEWLSKSTHEWPVQDETIPCQEVLPELKRVEVSLFSCTLNCPIEITRFSNYHRLVRSMAYALRFISFCRKSSSNTGPLKSHEINGALSVIVKNLQREHFHNELKCLLNNDDIPAQSKLRSFNPFIDKEGLIRVGGRLVASTLEETRKHPILLPKHYLTKLIFRYEHFRLGHAGPQLLLSSIRERFWPLGGRNYARRAMHECKMCFRCNPRNIPPQMGNLPAERVTQALPFQYVGTDYAGPLQMKNKIGRGSKLLKCYVAVFVCFTTKAVHLELVSDLSTDAFLAAFKRFISRRGKPTHVYSDNGTNFVGAYNELKQLFELVKTNHEIISDWLTVNQISWSFIPPSAPHFGGLWEAGVKSLKYHLRRIAGASAFTFEQLTTLLTQIEAILNSRPLTPLTTDPNDLEPLTPSHFLIGRKLTSLPEPNYSEIPPTRLSDLQRVQQLLQSFWKRWHSEYLHELQQRRKWTKPVPNITEGTLVLLKLDNASSLSWPLGRVTKVIHGADGVVRVVTVRTRTGEYKRAVSKLYPLPLSE